MGQVQLLARPEILPAASGPQAGPSQQSFLSRSLVRGHRSEMMLGVLIVVLRTDQIPGEG